MLAHILAISDMPHSLRWIQGSIWDTSLCLKNFLPKPGADESVRLLIEKSFIWLYFFEGCVRFCLLTQAQVIWEEGILREHLHQIGPWARLWGNFS